MTPEERLAAASEEWERARARGSVEDRVDALEQVVTEIVVFLRAKAMEVAG